jgi:outer membrane lipoprotein LolB
MLRGLCLVIALLLLVGCAGQDRRDSTPLSWAEHRSSLELVSHWNAKGKLALRTSERAESATILWRQQGLNTELHLSGPIGLSATTIHSNGQKMDIRQGDELRTVDISTPDAIALNTGWDLPLQALPYWLKGIPAPDSSVQLLELDSNNALLLHLQQDNWDIHYTAYEQFDGLTLPTRLQIERGGTRVRMIIRSWQALLD